MKMNKEVVMVRISDIIPNRFQPRITFDEEALNELSNSIKEHGIIQPLILRDLGSKYEIIAGERRYKAATLAGLETVPAIIGAMDDQTSAELALIENIQRKDLSAIEEAKSYKKILDMGNFTQDELAKRMGKSQSSISNKMRLLSLTNEVQMALMNNLISERHARCLLQIKEEDKQKEVLNKIMNERMNVRDTDSYIKNIMGITSTSPEIEQEKPIIDIPMTEEKPIVEEIKIPETIPVVEDKPIKEEVKESNTMKLNNDGNPNIYAQDKHDFVDLNNLTSSNNEVINDIEKPSIELPVDNFTEDSTEEPIIDRIEVPEEKHDDNSKIKLATAIKLTKDIVEEIKAAGYTVSLEEVDEENNYKIIINVEK